MAAIFLATQLLIRITLLLYSANMADLSIFAIVKLFSVGFVYDLASLSYWMLSAILYLWLVPKAVFVHRLHKAVTLIFLFAVIYNILFGVVSEWFFWEEFGKRFNFIAVDYLVYTTEVIRNIQESYPMPAILGGLFILTLLVLSLLYKVTHGFDLAYQDKSNWVGRTFVSISMVLVSVGFFMLLDRQHLATSISANRYNQELAKNGTYSLFSAFRNNELKYEEFYKTKNIDDVMSRYKELASDKHSKFVSQGITKMVKKGFHIDPQRHKNVILVMIESMSAKYMGIYGNDQNLTPHMDELAGKSLFFDHLFATGTRTVRGMEAVTMSVPPTPGRSIVKRPSNHNMFGIGWVFKDKGYKNRFIYAGHGYFDNMNEYFSHNGFDIVDRLDFEDDEISFSNVWGVCDEDLLDKTIQKADESYAKKEPFFSFVMTTSNHRPYTYPNDKIGIPSHTGRKGGVKYTDYAIDDFLQKASTKPWFDDTIFIFVADHNGGSAGKTDLPLHRYKIPLIVYAPKLIKPQTISKISSQIDLAPTLFSILNWSYESKFYGHDILSDDFRPRALIGNYQKLGLYRDDKLTILLPDGSVKEYKVEKLDIDSNKYEKITPIETDVDDTITYYQSASHLYETGKLTR